MTSLSATGARREFFDLLKRTIKGHRVCRIRHRDGSAVRRGSPGGRTALEEVLGDAR